MPRQPTPDLRECKTDAKRLLGNLQSDDSAEMHQAVERFRATAPWTEKSVDEIIGDRDEFQLKHAQAVVAAERGFAGWKELKDAADVAWYPRGGSAHFNIWFARYGEARECRDKTDRYLLTHRGKYFVCESEFIRTLGLDPNDPRWDAIGRDVAHPQDRRACEELQALAEKAAKQPVECGPWPDPA